MGEMCLGALHMTNVTFVADTTSQAHELRVLVYSDDRRIRDAVMTGLGRRPAKDLPKIEFIQVATEPVVKRELKAGNIDLAILDGEAAPAGGMGIARNAKDEVFNCPPIIVLIQRSQDAWLATWSKAEGVVPMPIDPVVLTEVATTLLRRTDKTAIPFK